MNEGIIGLLDLDPTLSGAKKCKEGGNKKGYISEIRMAVEATEVQIQNL